MEERMLVKRAKHGDTDAFAMLYAKDYKKMYHFALYTLKNIQDAEDVVSETVMEAFASIKKLKSEEAFSSWVFRILSNKCKQKMKTYYQRKQEESINQEGFEMSDCSRNAEWSIKKEEYYDVRKVFFELPDEERMIVGMHLFFGYKSREIAEMLQMNENTVRSKESRAIQKMGNQLKDLR